jgi:hypothetical protein
MNIVLALPKFRTKLSAANCLIVSERTKFDGEQKSSKFLLAITTLLPLANNIHSDAEFIFRRRPFIYIYIMNNTDPRIDPWGIPCFSVPQSEKKCRAELGGYFNYLYSASWNRIISGFEPFWAQCTLALMTGPLCPIFCIGNRSPVPLAKFQMAPMLSSLMSSRSRKKEPG